MTKKLKIIIGYTDPDGASILTETSYENSKQVITRRVNFIVRAWYEEGKKLIDRSLLLSMRIDENEVKKYSQSLKGCTVKVSVSDEKINRIAMVEEIIDTDFIDEKLNEFIEAYRLPIEYCDDKLGIFILDKHFYCFVREVTWCNSCIKLEIETRDKNIAEKIISKSMYLIDESVKWDQKIKKYASENLLHIKNEAWLDEDDFEHESDDKEMDFERDKSELRRFTEEDFVNRIKITSICIGEDDSLAIWLDDGNIFLGHTIEVLGKTNGTFTSATFQG